MSSDPEKVARVQEVMRRLKGKTGRSKTSSKSSDGTMKFQPIPDDGIGDQRMSFQPIKDGQHSQFQPIGSGQKQPPKMTPTPTGKHHGSTPIFGQEGADTTSPVTGANIGLSQWGKPLTGSIGEDKWGGLLAGNPELAAQIREAGETRFGTVTDRQIVSLVNKITNEGMPVEEALRLLNSGYQYNPEQQRAANLVDMQIKPQENALERALKQMDIYQQRDQQAQQQFSQYGDNKLAEISQLLQEQLQGGVQKMGGIFDNAQQQVSGAYQGAAQANQQGLQQVQSQLTGDAERLGLQEALTDPLAELAQQVTQANTGLNAQGAGATGNLAALGGSMQGVAQQGVMDAAREGAQGRTNLVHQVQQALADIGLQYGEQRGDMQGQLADLGQQRGPMLQEMYTQLTKANSEEERQKILDDFAMKIQQGTLDLQKGELDFNKDRWKQEFGLEQDKFDFAKSQNEFDRTLAMQDRALALQKHELEVQMLQRQLQGATPEEQALIMLDIQKRQAEIAKINAETNKISTGAGTPVGSGQTGVTNYIQRAGLPPTVSQAVMAYINSINGGQGALLGEPAYNKAIQGAAQYAAQVGIDPMHVTGAINAFFGKG